MKEKNTGKTFELLVQEVYQVFLNYSTNENGYRKINVQHNVSLRGKTGVDHQIDVYWEFELGGRTYATLVEVKDWKSPVKLEQMQNFKAVIDDIPGLPNGIFVSRSGFQSGAIKYAQAHGISLIQLSKATKLSVFVRDVVTYYDNTTFIIDSDWVKEDCGRKEKVLSLVSKKSHHDTKLINPKGERVQLYQLMCIDAIPYYFNDDNIRHKVNTPLQGQWYWVSENEHLPLVKVSGYSFECYNSSEYCSLEIDLGDLANYIITDLTKGKEHVFYPGSKKIEEKKCIHLYSCY